jgi:hypothetical protein
VSKRSAGNFFRFSEEILFFLSRNSACNFLLALARALSLLCVCVFFCGGCGGGGVGDKKKVTLTMASFSWT